MRLLPPFAAHELMDISDETAVLRDDDRHPGFRRNLSMAMKTERMCFLRKTAGFHNDSVLQQPWCPPLIPADPRY